MTSSMTGLALVGTTYRTARILLCVARRLPMWSWLDRQAQKRLPSYDKLIRVDIGQVVLSGDHVEVTVNVYNSAGCAVDVGWIAVDVLLSTGHYAQVHAPTSISAAKLSDIHKSFTITPGPLFWADVALLPRGHRESALVRLVDFSVGAPWLPLPRTVSYQAEFRVE